MMFPRLLIILLALGVPCAAAGDGQRVPFDAVSTRVIEHLRALSADLPGELELTVLSRGESVAIPEGRHELRIAGTSGRWPRPRVAVSVEHRVDEKAVRNQVVWVAAHWWMQADVHADGAAQGTPTAALRFRRERVDLAPYGPATEASQLPGGQRLRRPVRAGRPVLASDFEPLPDVLAGAELQVEVARGAVRLSTVGRAMSDGSIGDVIPVSLGKSRPPVDSMILSSKAVRVED